MDTVSASDNFLRHEPCPKCGSTDNLARYSDGHGYCFGCGYRERGEGEVSMTQSVSKDFEPLQGEVKALIKRGIHTDTCAIYGYTVGKHKDKPVQIANYRKKDGTLVGQKVRYPDKSFSIRGSIKGCLYGMQLVRSRKYLVITEGELDALSVSQASDNKYPAVSIPNGAQGALKTLTECIEYLREFETVILYFDNDTPGQDAAKECAEKLAGMDIRIAVSPKYKDANEALQAEDFEAISQAVWNAQRYRPDGLVSISDVMEQALTPVSFGIPWFLESLTKFTYGRRTGEVYTIGAGTGVGKTDLVTQSIAYDLQTLKMPVGVFFLEQSVVETVRRLAGKVMGRTFHLPDTGWTQEELEEGLKSLGTGLTCYDSFGLCEWDSIKEKVIYLSAQGVKLFYIDHLTALATGQEGMNEKDALEYIMADIAGLAKRLDIIIHLISHLTTPEGKPHEEGGRVTIRHFKGSRAIGFWSYLMLGMERNQQAEDESERQTTCLRILKNRIAGHFTGKTVTLTYDSKTGLIHEIDDDYGLSEEF